MRVLIADFDLFAKTGGGQTFYRSIIEANPEIEFYYFCVSEQHGAIRPANAQSLPFRELYKAPSRFEFCDLPLSPYFLPAFAQANNVAYSARGRDFDVVDVPDYQHFGAFLRPALAKHGVGCRRIALSLHGSLSATISLNWKTEGQSSRDLADIEDAQFQAVDLRYGLSRNYLDEWRVRSGVESHYLDPRLFFRFPTPSLPAPSCERPNLQFIGRTEKCKGPDIFVEMAWWLPQESFARALVVGPQSWDPAGVGSSSHLAKMIDRRFSSDKVTVLPAATKRDLERLYASRAITVLPSRYDTFNLVALESLMSGCPTAIGSKAGACRFLEETFPNLPFIKIDMDDWRGALPAIEAVLHGYDAYRSRLVDAVRETQLAKPRHGLLEIYQADSAKVEAVCRNMDEWYERLTNRRSQPLMESTATWKAAGKRIVKAHTSEETRRRLRALNPKRSLAAAKNAVKTGLRNSWMREHAQGAYAITQAQTLLASYREVRLQSELCERDLQAKAEHIGDLISRLHADRIRLWRELARIESLRGDTLTAATYRLRAMRLAGDDRFEDLPGVQATLDRHGFHRESAVAAAMFGPREERDERSSHLLADALERNRRISTAAFEFVDDRRPNPGCKVSVIVSLYHAADKLPAFLRALRLQTLFAQNQAEIVLVDSGSPSDEYAGYRALADELQLPVVYARTSRRETIQAAWNRGIGLSRGEYLSFLGVDEGILPPTLELLARELDADLDLDWVQANSLMTNVNAQGWWLNDIMTYDRADYSQSLVYLDTCYLSWVGALYRKSIHQRCGYYDPTFGAAGDTEFKNRVLPFIKSKSIPQMLGVFWNYPSGQTTCSPRAEIEDLRAWYLHRTLAGVRYAFGRRDPAEAEDLLYATLRYRKSYCQHWSTDVEYAYNLARFLRERREDSPAEALFDGIANLLGTYRSLDYLPKIAHSSLVWSLSRAFYVAHKESRRHFEISGERVRPAYQVFNDNRHEQHTQLWGKAA